MISDNKKEHKLRRFLGIITPFVLTVIFLLLAFRNVDLSRTIELISEVSIPWMLLFIFVFYVSHFIRAVRWKVILKSVKPNTSIHNLFGAVLIGYGVNCAVPRLGEVYRASFLGRWENLSRTSMLGSVIVERIIDLAVLAVSVIISISIYNGDLLNQINWLQSALVIISIGVFVLLLFLVALIFFRGKLSKVLLKVVGKLSDSVAERLNYAFSMLTEGLSTIKSTGVLFSIILLSAIIMLFYGLNSYVGLLMLNMDDIQSVNFGMGWVVMTIAAFGVVLPTPGGTGSYHIITKLTLVTLYGFTENIGFAYAFLTHIIAYILFVLTTVGVVIFSNANLKKEGREKINFISVFKNNIPGK